MTHTEKLQQIFEAALKDSSELNKPLTRTFPASLGNNPVAVVPPAAEFAPSPKTFVDVPAKPFVIPAALEAPATTAASSESESEKSGSLREQQEQPKTGTPRRNALMTLGVLAILTGNAFSWFVHSPQRVVALSEAIQNVRSVGDVKSVASNYQSTLDKIVVRSKQIRQANASIAAVSNQAVVTGPHMDFEMPTMDQENRMHAIDAANDLPTTAGLTSDGSYR